MGDIGRHGVLLLIDNEIFFVTIIYLGKKISHVAAETVASWKAAWWVALGSGCSSRRV